jgi:hypothetical protein
MTTKTKSNPHRWFFAYVNSLEGYNRSYAKVIREGIIREYADGLTESLADLYANYPAIYERMKRELTRQSQGELDKARKRLIAVLFSYLRGENPTTQYVKAMACRAARQSCFNDIPLQALKELYGNFVAKSMPDRTELERGLIMEGMRKERRN